MAWKRRWELGGIYDYASFTVPDSQTNYDVKSNQAATFSNIKLARGITIKTNKDITVRFNRSTFPAIVIKAYESPFEMMDKIDIKNVFITTAVGDADIEIMLI